MLSIKWNEKINDFLRYRIVFRQLYLGNKVRLPKHYKMYFRIINQIDALLGIIIYSNKHIYTIKLNGISRAFFSVIVLTKLNLFQSLRKCS